MPSTYSPSLKIELIANGEQAGTWGQTTNNNLGTIIEQAITGVQTISLTGYSNYTLSNYNGLDDEARNIVLVFSGALSSTCNVIAPSVQKTYIVANNAGANVTIKTATGTGISLLNNSSQFIYCDGSEFYSALNVNSIVGDLSVTGNETVGITFAVNSNVTFSGNLTSLSNSLSFSSYTGIVDAGPSTGALIPPTGTTGQRPSSLALGTARWNTTLGWYEIWNGTTWVSITGSYTASYLIVAGGGGANPAGGGGAGGLLANSTTVTTGTSYTIVVGSGGAGAGSGNASKGANSSAFSLTAIGGGYAGGATGGNGGSGGGGSTNSLPAGSFASGGSGTAGQGNIGGSSGYNYAADLGGGGGGAGAAGTDGVNDTTGGSGGDGVQSSITGTALYYAGGGYGRIQGGSHAGQTGTAGLGQSNYGGGAGAVVTTGAAGNNGVVIISYQAAYQRGTGGTVTNYVSSGSTYYVHTFTSSGTFIA